VTDLAGFVALAIVVIVTPGPDTALTIRNTLVGGRPAGIATAVGVALGQAVRGAQTRERGVPDLSRWAVGLTARSDASGR
jgi:hypothetical protein